MSPVWLDSVGPSSGGDRFAISLRVAVGGRVSRDVDACWVTPSDHPLCQLLLERGHDVNAMGLDWSCSLGIEASSGGNCQIQIRSLREILSLLARKHTNYI